MSPIPLSTVMNAISPRPSSFLKLAPPAVAGNALILVRRTVLFPNGWSSDMILSSNNIPIGSDCDSFGAGFVPKELFRFDFSW